MATDYSKKKNAELEDLLKSRSLPHTGKKAELVARLQQYDADQTSKPTTTTTTTTAPTASNEDEIDWEDDAAAATDPSSAAAIAAGGLTAPPNPTAVPNQKIDTDPSRTSDLTVNPPAPASPTPKPDLSANLPTTTLDAELAKRRARAARFGIKESAEDALKALERAKKFGSVGGGEGGARVGGLDEALPERGVKRGRGREGGRGGEGVRDGEGREVKRSRVRGEKGGSEKDRVAAETRKARFMQKA